MGFWGAIESLRNEGWKENKGKESKSWSTIKTRHASSMTVSSYRCTRLPVNSTRRHTTRKINGAPMDIEAS